MRSLAVVLVVGMLGSLAHADDVKPAAAKPAAKAPPKSAAKAAPKPAAKSRISGAGRVFSASWGLVAQGSGQVQILPTGKSTWQIVHKVKDDSLYRVAYDDAGRLMASWEKESFFHVFVPAKKQDVKFEKPRAPSADFKYGYSLADLYFTKDGNAIVYMHGFLGGRMWATVAYHYTLDKPAEPPTLLFRQSGYPLTNNARLGVFALPKDEKDACEHNSCHPLGEIVAWEIDGTKATKKVLLSGQPNNKLSRVFNVESGDEDRIGVVVTEHPHKRHLLRWRWGDPKAEFRPLPDDGLPNAYDTEAIRLTASNDIVEVWMNDERGLEIKRIPLKGDPKVTKLAPLPKRTKNDRPLFHISATMERTNGDLLLYWGEYLMLLPQEGAARRLDMRSLFKSKSEFTGIVVQGTDPEGFWIGAGVGRGFDFVYLSFAELDRRLQPHAD